MNTTSFTTRNFNPRVAPEQQALVLGGGGSAGNAWLIGVITGLFEAGVDTTTADLMIGTSAGSTAAAQIACADPSQLLADILSSVPKQRPPQTGVRGESGRQGTAGDSMRRTGEIVAAAKNSADMRRRMGAAALDLAEDSGELGPQRWRETVAARLPSLNWPEKRLLITAVDAHNGEPTVLDRASGIELVDAVAASCANGPAYSIGDGAFIDGGYRRSSENADLAAGYGRVLVLSPLGGRTRHPLEWGMQLEVQVAELRASGSAVEVILPDSNSLAAFGANMMDQSTRPAAARAGYNQGRTIAGDLTGFWR